MFTSLFTALLAVTAVCGMRGYSNSGYSNSGPFYPPPRDLAPDFDKAEMLAADLKESDKTIMMSLEGVDVKIQFTTAFMEKFENEILPRLNQEMKEQDMRIAAAFQDLVGLKTLGQEADRLLARLNGISDQVREIKEFRRNVLNAIQNLNDGDVEKNRAIAAIEDQINRNEGRVQEAGEKMSDNEGFALYISDKLEEVRVIVNAEKAQSHTVKVFKGAGASKDFNVPFTNAPRCTWQIVGYKATEESDSSPAPSYGNSYRPTYGGNDGYGDDGYSDDGYSDDTPSESLYVDVEVTCDEYGFHATLDDQSIQWDFEYVLINVIAFHVDDSIIEH